MGYLDVSVNSRAPASSALSTGTWTSGRADNLDQITSTRMAKVDTLETRLTATRAGNLDQITSTRMAKVDILETRLTSSRAAALDTVNKTMTSQLFTSSGTWTKPTGVTEVWVEVVGGGGGGGTAASSSPGSGGGSGGRVTGWVPVTGNVAVYIGAGGAPNTDGSQSSFGAIIADGGRRGTKVLSMYYASASGGSCGIGGSPGELSSYTGFGGNGGGGVAGGLGAGNTGANSNIGGNAVANTGGGGGGGRGSGGVGGSGASGYVRVVWRQ